MSHKLIDRNDDLRKLRDEGYNVDIHAASLVVRDIPYVNDKREVCRGILVTALEMNGEIVNPPTSDHTIKFAGEYPCSSDGQPIAGLRQNSDPIRISAHLTTQHSFSAKKDQRPYQSYYEKVTTYANILSGPAAVLQPGISAKTFAVVIPQDEDSPFHYLDTASARAEINMITQKLAVQKIAIVGVGGTGSYVLDFLAKTPVKEIHIFDGDKFSSHNAFRAPGAASIDSLHKQELKVEYFAEIYSRLHRGIIQHPQHVDESNVDQLRGFDCVFLSMDSGPRKKLIVEKLEEFGVLFIDVGIGLYSKTEKLGGIVRTVTSTPENRDRARARISFAGDDGVNEYDKNIQIADLNALNAVLAVIRWKKICGFYFDTKKEHFTSYSIGGNLLLSEDLDE